MSCPHGKTSNWWWDLFTLGDGWAGGLSTCSCCGAEFGYLDSGSWSAKGSHTETWTKDLCSECGGYSKVEIVEFPNPIRNHFL